jgi:hypothetical protein
MLPATFHDHAAREGRDVMKRSTHVSHIDRAPTSTNSIITLCFTYVIEAFSTIHEILLNVPRLEHCIFVFCVQMGRP